jgi:thioredoxin-like negative regulator of GroEL
LKRIENSYEIGIKSIPLLLIFKDGKGIARRVASSSKEAYQKIVEQSLSKHIK